MESTDKIKVLVVDDEPIALRGITQLLRRDPELQVLRGCSNGPSALKSLNSYRPDLLLLDIQMPGMNGLELTRAIGPENLPHVIFITAFDQYAIDAFEARAFDYLLKPFSDDRFFGALERGKQAVQTKRLADRNAIALATLENTGHPDARQAARRIAVRVGVRVYFVNVDEIDWIQGADYYASIHSGGRLHLVRESLQSLSCRLDPKVFQRVHRSAIVNINKVKEIQGALHGEAIALLSSGARVRIARGRRGALERTLEGRDS